MPDYASAPRWLAAWSALLLSACGAGDSGGRFEVSEVAAAWSSGRLEVRCEQQLSLGSEARAALEHGVPLTIEVELLLRDSSSQTRVGSDTARYEIRYLPLSERYQLSTADGELLRTYPRLRHALAELARVDLSLTTGALPTGDYELLVRSRLSRNHLPPPMRLPALLSAQWDHDSDWTSWPVAIGQET